MLSKVSIYAIHQCSCQRRAPLLCPWSKNLIPCDGIEVADQCHCSSDSSENGGSSNEGEEEVLERRSHGGLGSERMSEGSSSRDDNGSLESSGLVLLRLSAVYWEQQ